MGRFIVLPALMALMVSIPAQADAQGSKEYGTKTVMETLESTDNYSTFAKAIETAGLAETLSGEGPFTIFSPTNDAFDALPEGTLDSLLESRNRDKLVEILTYHILEGKVMSSDIMGKSMDRETVEGSDLSIDGRSGDRAGKSSDTRMNDPMNDPMNNPMDERAADRAYDRTDEVMTGDSYNRKDNKSSRHYGITINDAKVIKADIKASNGVIHGIDKVLMPD